MKDKKWIFNKKFLNFKIKIKFWINSSTLLSNNYKRQKIN